MAGKPRTQLQTQSLPRIVLYSVAAVAMVLLSCQNYLYGLYDAFYPAFTLINVFTAGAVYATLQRQRPLDERAHTAVFLLAILIIDYAAISDPQNAPQLLYPLALLSFLILPLRTAARLSGLALVLTSLIIALAYHIYPAMVFLTSFFLCAGLAALFAFVFQHKGRSLVELSIHDPLTGAYNIKHFDETLAKEISRAQATGFPLSMVVVEVDYFDQLSELNGQAAIEEIIIALSRMIGQTIRTGDSHYFFKDGIFYLLLPNTPEEGSLVMAERIRRAVEESEWPIVDSITASVGCTSLSETVNTTEEMLACALSGLRTAQSTGHNKVIHTSR